jgi:nucleotide-binding universal stress UspA family protein
MSRVLVVANQTLTGHDLLELIKDRMAKEPCEFSLLVPATLRAHRSPEAPVPGINAPLDTEDDNYAEARDRLELGLSALQRLGATVDGSVGDADPVKAIQEVLARRRYDEIILSTLPSGVSRWLRQDLPHKVERRFHLPVTVVTATTPANPQRSGLRDR